MTQLFHRANQRWLRYEYKHTTFAILLIIAFVAAFDSTIVRVVMGFVEQMGYLGAFIAGVLSVSFFTAVPAAVLLVDMANEYDPIALAIVAGAGSMIGDWLLLLFFEEKVVRELHPLFAKLGVKKLHDKLQHKYTRWVLFLLGAVIISTPLPDELGIALLGMSHIRKVYVLGICFLLNVTGLLVLIEAVRIFT